MDISLLGFSGLKEVFNVHPVFVHFPIALFPSALFLYGLGFAFKRPSWLVAGRACLYLGTVSAIITIVTGLMAEGSIPHNERIHHIMQTHKQIGYFIGALSILLGVWSFIQKEQRPKAAPVFLGLLLFVTYLVLQNGDLGGRMVFVEGAGVKPAVSTVTSKHIHEVAVTERPKPHHQEGEVHHESEHHHAH